MALRFFSRLPAGSSPHEAPSLSRMAPALPFVGLAIGLPPALLLMLLCWLGVPSHLAATLGIGTLVLLTGAMAEDAIADAADGLGGGTTAERRLEIMKDSRHGSYGVVAIVLYLGARIAAIGAAAALNPLAAGAVLVAAGIAGRSGSLWLVLKLPPARHDGASAAVGPVGKTPYAVGAGFAALLCFVLAAPFAGILGLVLAAFAAFCVASLWVWLCRRLVGGQTGDLTGALHALIETAVLVVLVTFV